MERRNATTYWSFLLSTFHVLATFKRTLGGNAAVYALQVLLTLTVVTCLAGCTKGMVNDDPSAEPASVLYFVPEDQAQLHPDGSVDTAERMGLNGYIPVDLRPQALQDFHILDIEPTTSWDTVVERALQSKLKAVIIHRAARDTMTQADIDALRIMFRSGVVVAGIGIPGQELASDMVGVPSMFIWPNEVYRTPYYYYMYHIEVDGTPEQKAQIFQMFEEGASEEDVLTQLSNLSDRGSFGHQSASDSLLYGGVENLLRSIESAARP